MSWPVTCDWFVVGPSGVDHPVGIRFTCPALTFIQPLSSSNVASERQEQSRNILLFSYLTVVCTDTPLGALRARLDRDYRCFPTSIFSFASILPLHVLKPLPRVDMVGPVPKRRVRPFHDLSGRDVTISCLLLQ